MPNRKTNSPILCTGIKAYVDWYREMQNHTFIIAPEGNFYLVNGIRVNCIEFESNNPMPEIIRTGGNKGKHLDSRSNFY